MITAEIQEAVRRLYWVCRAVIAENNCGPVRLIRLGKRSSSKISAAGSTTSHKILYTTSIGTPQ